jgi:hypothetical protein
LYFDFTDTADPVVSLVIFLYESCIVRQRLNAICERLQKVAIPEPNKETLKQSADVMDLPRNIQPLPRRKGNADFEAYNVRNQFRKYFCSREGQVAWQLAHGERVN